MLLVRHFVDLILTSCPHRPWIFQSVNAASRRCTKMWRPKSRCLTYMTNVYTLPALVLCEFCHQVTATCCTTRRCYYRSHLCLYSSLLLTKNVQFSIRWLQSTQLYLAPSLSFGFVWCGPRRYRQHYMSLLMSDVLSLFSCVSILVYSAYLFQFLDTLD